MVGQSILLPTVNCSYAERQSVPKQYRHRYAGKQNAILLISSTIHKRKFNRSMETGGIILIDDHKLGSSTAFLLSKFEMLLI